MARSLVPYIRVGGGKRKFEIRQEICRTGCQSIMKDDLDN